jgi:hypothetical protein
MAGPSILDQRQTRITPEQQKKIDLRRDRELSDLRTIMGTAEGRRILWRVLGECHMFDETFTGNSMDTFRAGRRSVGLKFFKDAHRASHELFRTMEDEAANEEQSNKKGV